MRFLRSGKTTGPRLLCGSLFTTSAASTKPYASRPQCKRKLRITSGAYVNCWRPRESVDTATREAAAKKHIDSLLSTLFTGTFTRAEDPHRSPALLYERRRNPCLAKHRG